MPPEAPAKAGHLGTLDPAASGVLPLCLGKATRLSRFAGQHDKTYVFEAVFGRETDTLDAEGVVVRESGIQPRLPDVKSALTRFLGTIEQRPPKFSAVRWQGRRAYRMARRQRGGKHPQEQDFELPTRQVTIHYLNLLDFRGGPPSTALLEVSCSAGTYVRSLCADIGEALGCGAYVGFLSRKAAGPFRLEDSWTLEELEKNFTSALLKIDWPLAHLPEAALNAEQTNLFCQGTALEGMALEEEDFFRVYGIKPSEGLSGEMELIGIGRRAGALLAPEVVIFHG